MRSVECSDVKPELDHVPARRTISDDVPSSRAEARDECVCNLVRSPRRRVELQELIGPRGVVSSTALHFRPGRLADVDETAIPAAEPPFMFLYVGGHEVHELDMRACSQGCSPPGLASLFTVVDSIDYDIVAESQILLRHRSRRLVRRDTNLPP